MRSRGIDFSDHVLKTVLYVGSTQISKQSAEHYQPLRVSENFEFGAVQKYVNLVDFEKCYKM